ncbi:hypothetical protein HDV62DRAFT_384356 [Trichoderma sp. SZMC 28011]
MARPGRLLLANLPLPTGTDLDGLGCPIPIPRGPKVNDDRALCVLISRRDPSLTLPASPTAGRERSIVSLLGTLSPPFLYKRSLRPMANSDLGLTPQFLHRQTLFTVRTTCSVQQHAVNWAPHLGVFLSFWPLPTSPQIRIVPPSGRQGLPGVSFSANLLPSPISGQQISYPRLCANHWL